MTLLKWTTEKMVAQSAFLSAGAFGHYRFFKSASKAAILASDFLSLRDCRHSRKRPRMIRTMNMIMNGAFGSDFIFRLHYLGATIIEI